MQKLVDKLRAYANAYEHSPLGREVDGTVELLKEAADKLAAYGGLKGHTTACDVDKAVKQLESVSIPENKILYASPDRFGVYVLLEDAVRIIREMEGQVS